MSIEGTTPIRPAYRNECDTVAESGPLVSVVIPTYNSGLFIRRAVESVLAQGYRQYEIIVVDDGSSDDTRALLHELDNRITYLWQENRGCSAARNVGILAARGAYVCFLDADDEWLPDKLGLQVAFMQGNPEIGLLFTDQAEIKADSGQILCASLVGKSRFDPTMINSRNKADIFTWLLMENFIPTSAVMIRRECFYRAGIFDETLRVSEDRDLWSRVAASCGVAFLPRVLGTKRVHSRNISSDSELTLRSRLIVWEKAHRLFPKLTEGSTVDALSADAKLRLSYLLLERCKRSEALHAAMQSMFHRIRLVFRSRTAIGMVPYSWWRAAGAIAVALTPLPMHRFLLQAAGMGRRLRNRAFIASIIMLSVTDFRASQIYRFDPDFLRHAGKVFSLFASRIF